MQRKSVFSLLLFFIASLSLSTMLAQHGENQHEEMELQEVAPGVEGKEGLKKEIKEYINHHLLDSHDFSLYSYTNDAGEKVHIGFPLPVILWDGGLKVFSSSKFHHGEEVAEVGGEYYTLYHNKVYKTNAQGDITLDDHHHPTNVKPFDLSITKNVFTIFMVGLLLLWMFSSMAKSYKKGALPSGMGRFLEPIVLYIRDDIAIPNIGLKHYKRYMSFLLSVFFFIWIINLLGLTPLGVNVTNNIAVTFALAILTYLITTFSGNKNYWKHIFWMPGVPVPMKIILAPIELLGTFIKPFSLLIRLYANITAGHIVLMSIIGLMFIFKNWIGSSLSFGLAFVLSLLELLVAALQAYIFTMLSALYFGSAVEEHHDDH
ncbi:MULTISPECIES: F0F1 ATP synthase subunit A [Mangrovimonas]|uniref:F0F1 ATP synthase subunit A n=1 Tax=Mangrovimonas TaxID=1211036 RepID=UPI00141DC9F8|nr:F0F1 ATP synthase subunit A [Mangrovimonas sp. CR14]